MSDYFIDQNISIFYRIKYDDQSFQAFALFRSSRFTVVFNRLQKNDYLWVSFLLKPQACSRKKKAPEVFPESLHNISKFFFLRWWLLQLNTIHFLYCVDLISEILLSTLAIFWLPLNISRANTMSHLWTAVTGNPRQLVDLLLITQAVRPKCS